NQLRATRHDRKLLLRKLGEKVLPASLDLRRKQGFSIPLKHWLKGKFGDYIESVLLGADRGIFDQKFIKNLIRENRQKQTHSERIFALAMFELWRRAYSVSPG